MASSIAEPEVAQEENGTNGSNGLKRRQSDASEQENKRQRTSPGKSSPTATETQPAQDSDSTAKPPQNATDPREARRKPGVGDEKQRSKRLFGALLGNLNRPPSDRVSKRRSEIEQRRKAELQKQDDERLEDRQRRLERLAVQRKREQIKIDEENMKTRHQNMLNTANFLATKAEPKLYYRPWDLLPDEEERVDDQIRDTKAQIEEEIAEFEIEKRKRLNELGDTTEDQLLASNNGDPAPESVAPAETQDAEKPNGEADQEAPSEPTNTTDTLDPAEVPESKNGNDPIDDDAGKKNDPSAPGEATASEERSTEQKDNEPKDEIEDEGDHLVVGDEDTVEY